MIRRHILSTLILCIFITACENSSNAQSKESGNNTSVILTDTKESIETTPNLDALLRERITELGINGDPAKGRNLPSIHTSLTAKLGRELFFDTQLSGDNNVACVSCHHPLLGGADALSLPVGVGAIDPSVIGPGRRHDGNFIIDPEADNGPNVERNSPTTFNIALYDQALFYDGRVQSIEENNGYYATNFNPSNNGEGDLIRTPDSLFNAPDSQAGINLTQAQGKFPLVSLAEMQGFKKDIGSNKEIIRNNIVSRFKNNATWINEFRKAFNDYNTSDDNVVTLDRLTHALSEYQRSQVFINNPWKNYITDESNISSDAKNGAMLFYTDTNNNGAGCFRCHSGDFYTDEKFYNLAVPQIGRGKTSQNKDLGRYTVTRILADEYAQRTPSLLNVSQTAPYGHSGAFNDLKDIIKHHINPQESINNYDFSLQHLAQMNGLGVSYPDAKRNTLLALDKYNETINRPYFKQLKPNEALSDRQIDQLVAFLKTLTDPCILSEECLQPWIASNENLSGNRLNIDLAPGFDNSSPVPIFDTNTTPEGYGLPDLGLINNYDPKCSSTPKIEALSDLGFVKKSLNAGIKINRGFSNQSMEDTTKSITMLINTGSMAAGDINGDCKIDLIFTQGDLLPIKIYLNNGDSYDLADNNWGLPNLKVTAGISLADLNGDGWLDFFTGDLFGTQPKVYLNNSRDGFQQIVHSGIKVNHATIGASFGDIDNDGDLDIFLAHWDINPGPEEEHLWLNNGSGLFTSGAKKYDLVGQFGDRDFVFTPNFADINKDGKQDLLIAADFKTSQYFIQKDNSLVNKTTNNSISDENGMGAALADFDNDLDLDWFVTSIYDSNVISGVLDPNNINLGWGFTGNRLYQNNTNDNGETIFTDIIPHTIEELRQAANEENIANGGWGWGACAADFDNDGWIDIYHVNGYNMDPMLVRTDLHFLFPILGLDGFSDLNQFINLNSLIAYVKEKSITLTEEHQSKLSLLYSISKLFKSLDSTGSTFKNSPSRLFINTRNNTFKEVAAEKNIADTGQGRGISCFDYDRDGDIDIVITNNTGDISFYENKASNTLSTSANFINFKLLDFAPNIHAIGAKVTIETNEGSQYKEVRVENNYISQNPIETHFGIGKNTKINKVSIIWPDGTTKELLNIDANQMLVIRH
jgi:cytochrome c peroxidase